MRVVMLAAILLIACSAQVAPSPSPGVPTDVVVGASVPNGRVEIVVKPAYEQGKEVRATVRLIPASGTLRGPLEPYVQASGFAGTAVVRHLAPMPVTASAGSAAQADVFWDATDETGRRVPADDYSLVIAVLDDQGRRTTVGATLTIRAP